MPACEPVVESRFKKPAHTDTDSTTCLHAPSIGLAIYGDALYNDVHPHLGESDAKGRKEWIAALDTIESLKSVAAIAGIAFHRIFVTRSPFSLLILGSVPD